MLKLLLLLSVAAFATEPPKKGPTGWEAYTSLQNGNLRFAEGHGQHPNQDPARRALVAGGQHPLAIVVACSDSRVAPETIFDQGLGDLFVVRLAGNGMSPEAIASIEYAVEHLGPRFLLVLGHESCGAVGAAVTAKPGVPNGSPSLDQLVRGIRAGLSGEAIEEAGKDKTLRRAVKENVGASFRALVQRSAIVRGGMAKGELVVGQGIYGLESGKVDFWDVGKGPAAAESTDKPVLRPEKVTEQVIEPELPRKKKKGTEAPAVSP